MEIGICRYEEVEDITLPFLNNFEVVESKKTIHYPIDNFTEIGGSVSESIEMCKMAMVVTYKHALTSLLLTGETHVMNTQSPWLQNKGLELSNLFDRLTPETVVESLEGVDVYKYHVLNKTPHITGEKYSKVLLPKKGKNGLLNLSKPVRFGMEDKELRKFYAFSHRNTKLNGVEIMTEGNFYFEMTNLSGMIFVV